MSKTTKLQESKLEKDICGCLETMYHQLEQINSEKIKRKLCKSIRWSFSLNSSDVEVSMQWVPCDCANGSLWQLTAGQQNSAELKSHSPSHWENPEAAAKRTLWSSVFHCIFSPPQPPFGRALYHNEELGSKAWNKNCFIYRVPHSGKGLTPEPGTVPSFPWQLLESRSFCWICSPLQLPGELWFFRRE